MSDLIAYFNHSSIFIPWVAQLLLCYGSILLMLRYFGSNGIIAYMTIMMIGANILVNKLVIMPFYQNPIPLGTVMYASTYLASDVLTECYGFKVAQKGIWISFLCTTILTVCIFLGAAFAPLSPDQASNFGLNNAISVQYSLRTLFIPELAILSASLITYVATQYIDVAIFWLIKRFTGERLLFVRNNASTLIAALVNALMFNILAFRLFAPDPLPWHIIIWSYGLATYAISAIIAILDTPFIYLAKYLFLRKASPRNN